MTAKVCSIYIEMVFPEKPGISSSKWVIWCEDISLNSARNPSAEFPATIVEGSLRAMQVFQSTIDMQKARGYSVFYNSEEM